MINKIKDSQNIVLILSGGMDSTTLLYHFLADPMYQISAALSFNYGQRHKKELECAKNTIEYIKNRFNRDIKHYILNVPFGQLTTKSSLTGNVDVPEGYYANENMKLTVVPNRNMIFISIAASLAITEQAALALGVHAGDHCFTSDTKILTLQGLKTVHQLNEGDIIYSFNTKDNKWERDTVQKIWRKNIVSKVKLINATIGSIKLTDEHEVYTLDSRNFHNAVNEYTKTIIKKKVKDLIPGDKLIRPSSITPLDKPMEFNLTEILSIKEVEYNDYVYDLSVQNNRNFLAGTLGQFLISNSIYPDCCEGFIKTAEHAVRIGNWDSDNFKILVPFLYFDKGDIVIAGKKAAKNLNIPITDIYKRTWTCYKGLDKACGKCGSCTERLEAFEKANLKDPIDYL